MTINASDLEVALSTYRDWVDITAIRNKLTVDQLSTVRVVFKDNTPEENVVYSANLSGNDLNDVAKVVRRQLLIDINNLAAQLDTLQVVRN
jgi:hypothetical protein